MSRLHPVLFVVYMTLIAAVFAEAGFYLGVKSFEPDKDYLTRLVWTLVPMSAPILIGICLRKYLHGFAFMLIPAATFAVGLTIGMLHSFDDELPYGLWKTFWITSTLTTALMWLSFSMLHIVLGFAYMIFTGGSLINDRPD